jgi:hypothetical protein
VFESLGLSTDRIGGDLWKLATDRLAGRVAAENAKDAFGDDADYAVDEYGRPFLRGQASRALPAGSLGVSPMIVIGAGLLGIALLVYLAKR